MTLGVKVALNPNTTNQFKRIEKFVKKEEYAGYQPSTLDYKNLCLCCKEQIQLDKNSKFDENGRNSKTQSCCGLPLITLWQDEKFLLTVSQTTNFTLFQTERVCRRQF